MATLEKHSVIIFLNSLSLCGAWLKEGYLTEWINDRENKTWPLEKDGCCGVVFLLCCNYHTPTPLINGDQQSVTCCNIVYFSLAFTFLQTPLERWKASAAGRKKWWWKIQITPSITTLQFYWQSKVHLLIFKMVEVVPVANMHFASL